MIVGKLVNIISNVCNDAASGVVWWNLSFDTFNVKPIAKKGEKVQMHFSWAN